MNGESIDFVFTNGAGTIGFPYEKKNEKVLHILCQN